MRYSARIKGIRMKRAIALAAMVLSAPAGSAHAADVLLSDSLSFEKFSLTPNISTLGVGIEGGYLER